MLKGLINLPGNLLRNIVGVLPHDEPENGRTQGYQEGENGHFKQWCEAQGGKVVGPGLCGFEVNEDDYKQVHKNLYKQINEGVPDEEIMRSSSFIDAYNHYMAGQPPTQQ